MSDIIKEDRPVALTIVRASAVSKIVAADKNDLLGALRAELDGYVPDMTTSVGRERAASLGRKVSSAKVAMLKLGDGLTEDARATVKAVGVEKKILEEQFDILRDELLAPLEEYRNIERNRVAAHERALAEIVEAGTFTAAHWEEITPLTMRERLAELATDAARDWQEFTARASTAVAISTDQINAAIVRREKADAEAAELAEFRAQQVAAQRAEAARVEAERQTAITAAAVEAERKRVVTEAEAAARAERERVAAEAQEAERRAEQERRAAQVERDRIEAERVAAEARERQAIADREAAEQRARDAEEAGRRAAENARLREEQAAADAEVRRAQAAAEAERRRVDAEQRAVEEERRRVERQIAARHAEERRLAEDKAHRTKVNNAMLTVLVEKAGLSAPAGKAVIALIIKGEMPNVTFRYGEAA
jgi:hypothetical protein